MNFFYYYIKVSNPLYRFKLKKKLLLGSNVTKIESIDIKLQIIFFLKFLINKNL